MAIDAKKIEAVQEILNLVINVGIDCAKIMAKNNITLDDVEELKKMIKEKPEDYFPNLK
jgi:hypothetical protein